MHLRGRKLHWYIIYRLTLSVETVVLKGKFRPRYRWVYISLILLWSLTGASDCHQTLVSLTGHVSQLKGQSTS